MAKKQSGPEAPGDEKAAPPAAEQAAPPAEKKKREPKPKEAKEGKVAKAKDAGADFAGSDEMIKRIQSEGWLDFDVALATQDMMGQVSRLGKVLGPRGLMPTPKAGTVIPAGGDVAAAVREFKAGKVEFRTDKGGNVHAGVGKLSFEEDKLLANVTTFVEQVRAAKPSGV